MMYNISSLFLSGINRGLLKSMGGRGDLFLSVLM
jgi:hypothetical protein